VQNRLNIARSTTDTAPNVYFPYLMENAFGDILQQQCNIQGSETSHNKYTDGQNNLNDCKVKINFFYYSQLYYTKLSYIIIFQLERRKAK